MPSIALERFNDTGNPSQPCLNECHLDKRRPRDDGVIPYSTSRTIVGATESGSNAVEKPTNHEPGARNSPESPLRSQPDEILGAFHISSDRPQRAVDAV